MGHALTGQNGNRGRCCPLCSHELAGRSIAHLADGRAVCRGCYDRTRLHRAAAKVEAIPTEPASGMPEQSVCSAIHGSLGDDDDAPIAGTVNGAGAMKAKPVASGQRAGVGAAARVEVKPSILRRAIDAWLGRRSAAGVGRTKGGEG